METMANIVSVILKAHSEVHWKLSYLLGIEVGETTYCIQLKALVSSGGQFYNVELN